MGENINLLQDAPFLCIADILYFGSGGGLEYIITEAERSYSLEPLKINFKGCFSVLPVRIILSKATLIKLTFYGLSTLKETDSLQKTFSSQCC